MTEAIENIIKYSPDDLSILRRKVVTKDILFNYLEENNIHVRLPVTKNELVDTIANSWNLPRISSHSQENPASDCLYSETLVSKTSGKENNVNFMAERFATWFYSMLNGNECGAEHFFPDAKLKINMHTDDGCESTQIENQPEEIGNTLLKIRYQHNLHFNPNETQDGIQGRMDPHGLVMVLTCGTLHIQNLCTGVFEQVFALARDPFSDNNWKIKNTELNLRSRNDVLEFPKLCDSELTSELLMLPCD